MRKMWLAAPTLVLAGAYLAIPGLAALGGPVASVYNASALLSAVTLGAAVAVRRPRPSGSWILIAAALALWVVGDGIYGWLETTTSGSIPDLAYVPAYVCLILALVRILRAHAGHAGIDTLIDAALIGVAGLMTMWELVIEPAWGVEGVSQLGRSIAALYPVLDVVLLVLVAQLLIVPGRKLSSVRWLAAGVLTTFVADLLYAVLAQSGSYGSSALVGRLLDGSWLVGYALLAVAAWHPSMVHVSEPPTARTRFGPARLVACGAALLTAPVVHIIALEVHGDVGIETLLLSTVTIIPLAVWRIARLNRSTQAALDQVARREAYYRGVAVNSSDAYVVVNDRLVVIDVSQALRDYVELSSSTTAGGDAFAILHEDDRALAQALIADARTKPGETLTGEVRANPMGDRPTTWVELRITNLLADSAVRGIVINAHDITARKLIEVELSHQAFHDSLTGLPNRQLIHNRITHALLRNSRRDAHTSVLFCDLDGFKSINDTLGHAVGDHLLQVVADRVQRAVRPADTVARMGGDEFIVLLEETTPDEASAAAQRILAALTDPFAIDGNPLVVTASIGLASAETGDGSTADELLRDADTAMYEAKGSGRNRVVVYAHAMRSRVLAKRAIEADLAGALERQEFEAFYQPVVRLSDGEIVGFEALVRWNHPTMGLLLPGDFIELAEDTGAIVEIGAWMLRTACLHAASWATSSEQPLSMAVNLSARQLADTGILSHVRDALAASGLDPSLLVLELTETMLVSNPKQTATRLIALRALGVHLAIDDFGVGYSSLSYLQQFPFDILKIDRSFVDAIDDPERLPAIVRGILDLAGVLGLEIIAEGIEDDVQRRSLVGEGCRLGQGYFFARPMTSEAASLLVEDGDRGRQRRELATNAAAVTPAHPLR